MPSWPSGQSDPRVTLKVAGSTSAAAECFQREGSGSVSYQKQLVQTEEIKSDQFIYEVDQTGRDTRTTQQR